MHCSVCVCVFFFVVWRGCLRSLHSSHARILSTFFLFVRARMNMSWSRACLNCSSWGVGAQTGERVDGTYPTDLWGGILSPLFSMQVRRPPWCGLLVSNCGVFAKEMFLSEASCGCFAVGALYFFTSRFDQSEVHHAGVGFTGRLYLPTNDCRSCLVLVSASHFASICVRACLHMSYFRSALVATYHGRRSCGL